MANLAPRRAYCQEVKLELTKLDPIKSFNLSKRNPKKNPLRYLIYVSAGRPPANR